MSMKADAVWERLNALETKVDNLAGQFAQVSKVIETLTRILTMETIALIALAGLTQASRLFGTG